MSFVSAPSFTPGALPVQMLLVDRDADTRRMYAQFLKFWYDIEEAEDGREALAKAIAHRPEVVITETRLPGMSGFSLCELLRSDTTTRDIRVVFVTGDAFDADVEHARRAGADAVLTKPCLPETLFAILEKLMAKSAEVRARARDAEMTVREEKARSQIRARVTALPRRATLSRALTREHTTTPPIAPPNLVCPVCDQPLTYVNSHTGGVNAHAAEQWDYFECGCGCGSFQYRHRTRKLRRVV